MTQFPNKFSSGFTLIELLIVIGITGILASVTLFGSNLFGFKQDRDLTLSADSVVATLRVAQTKAASQEHGKAWGVHFVNPASGSPYYQLFSGSSYTSSGVASQNLLSGAVVFTMPTASTTKDVIFSAATGKPTATAVIALVAGVKPNAATIAINSNGAISRLDDKGLIGYWPFDEGSGTTAYDGSGYSSNGTIVGGPTWQSGSSCKSGSCLVFNGSTQSVDIGDVTSLRVTGSQTIALWLSPSDFSARKNPYAKAYGGEGTITIETNGTVNYYYGTCGGNCTPYQGFGMTSALQANTWTHLAIVRDLSAMKLYWYKNGVKTNEVTASYSSATASTLYALIARGYVYNFSGVLDDVRVYNRALSADEVRTMYNATK